MDPVILLYAFDTIRKVGKRNIGIYCFSGLCCSTFSCFNKEHFLANGGHIDNLAWSIHMSVHLIHQYSHLNLILGFGFNIAQPPVIHITCWSVHIYLGMCNTSFLSYAFSTLSPSWQRLVNIKDRIGASPCRLFHMFESV